MKNRFSIGQLVQISKNIDLTHRRYSSNSTMIRMAGNGQFYKIQGYTGTYVKIEGYTWAKEDILVSMPPDSAPKIKRVVKKFDIRNLL